MSIDIAGLLPLYRQVVRLAAFAADVMLVLAGQCGLITIARYSTKIHVGQLGSAAISSAGS